MKLIPIDPDNLSLALKDVQSYIEDALRYSDDKYNLDDVVKMIKSHTLILWVVYNDVERRAIGCLLTEILQHPRCNALSVFLLGGHDFDRIVQTLGQLKEYAVGIGCKSIEFYGREGWEKVLKPYNFEKIHTVMRLKL